MCVCTCCDDDIINGPFGRRVINGHVATLIEVVTRAYSIIVIYHLRG